MGETIKGKGKLHSKTKNRRKNFGKISERERMRGIYNRLGGWGGLWWVFAGASDWILYL